MIQPTPMDKQLNQLLLRYSSALYAFFRVTNIKTEITKFINDPTYNPHFKYGVYVSGPQISKRLSELTQALKQVEAGDLKTINFLNRRIQETEILQLFESIYNDKALLTPKVKADYLKRQKKLYGPLQPELFFGILTLLKQLSKKSDTSKRLFKEVRGRLKTFEEHQLYSPNPEIFQHYRKIAKSAFGDLNEVAKNIPRQAYYDEALI